jgi:Undecaprenyl-phosphate glucose phosphotransferase
MTALDIRSARGRGAPLTTKWLSYLRLSHKSLAVIAVLSDIFAVVCASVLTGAAYHMITFGHAGGVSRYVGVGVVLAAATVALLKMSGLYASAKLLSVRELVRPVTSIWIGVFFFLLGVSFTLKISGEFSRGWILSLAVAGPVFILFLRLRLSRVMLTALRTGALKRREIILITNNGEPLVAPVEMLGAYDVVLSYLLPQDGDGARSVIDEAIGAARGSASISEIHLAMDWTRPSEIRHVLGLLKAVPLPVRLIADSAVRNILRYPQETLCGAMSFEVQRAPLTPAELAIKRAFDIVASAVGLLVFAPLLVAVAVAVKIDSPGPVLFRQARGGASGRTFNILKFRTMRVMEDGPVVVQATGQDERVTRIGRALRRSSIDELPQLINVLRGDMSLVGPRPHAIAHDVQYSRLIANYPKRQLVKPGITGWAQANGFRGETPNVGLMSRRCELDLWYITNWSLWLDIRILFRTAVEVCRARNAF